MKITKQRLRELIQEELTIEAADPQELLAALGDIPKAAQEIAERVKEEIEGMSERSGLDPMVLAQAVSALLTTDEGGRQT